MPKRRKTTQRSLSHRSVAEHRQPFIEHLLELRRRLFFVAVSILAWSVGAYFVQQHIVSTLLGPAKGQDFIYTSPGGGIDFLFRVCLYTGIVFSVPVIIFNLLKYFEPLMKKGSLAFIVKTSIASGLLAIIGILFGYFVGLPGALHFLMHQFTTIQITPMVTIQSYMSFVMAYMLGSAILLQVPLVLVVINRIKPIKPKKLLKYERWVIIIAFILGGLINPTPNVMDQVMLAGPMILMYQVGIFLVYWANRRRRPKQLAAMLARDAEVQAERHAKLELVLADTVQKAEDMVATPMQKADTFVAVSAQRVTEMTQHATATPALAPVVVESPMIVDSPVDSSPNLSIATSAATPPSRPERPSRYVDGVSDRHFRRTVY